MKNRETKEMKHRVIALLNREQMEYLDKISMDAMFSTGHKLTKVDIVAALVEAAKELGITGEMMKDKDALIEQVLRKVSGQKSERRQYPRLKNGMLVQMRMADSLEDYQNIKTQDISLGGFMIEMTRPIEPFKAGQLIEVMIKENEFIKALGRIIWINEKNDSFRIEMGVQLVYMKEEDLQRMKRNLSISTIKDYKECHESSTNKKM